MDRLAEDWTDKAAGWSAGKSSRVLLPENEAGSRQDFRLGLGGVIAR
jgi:hypothetical protein